MAWTDGRSTLLLPLDVLRSQGTTHLTTKVSEWEDTKTLIDRFAKGAH